MNNDLKLKLENTNIIIKAVVLIKYKNSFLLEFNKTNEYKTLPGGKIKINECSKNAVIRELKEELGLKLNYDRTIFSKVIENFYIYENQNYHEILFLYKYLLNDKEYSKLQNNLDNKDDKTSYFRFIEKNKIKNIPILPKEIKKIINKNYFLKYEKSCGAIIIDNEKALIIKQTNENWSFPKGHIEQKETEEETAIREIKEEVGLNVILDTNFRKTIFYCPDKQDTLKEVVFFLAKPLNDKITIQKEEVLDYKWESLQNIKEIFKETNIQEVIDYALEYIKKERKL